ncbi:TPA: cysteine hydrolase [Candidatus Woesearchaeota archaeon]|nr:cysteine hydrolase [Candidatus Woesearchaeota archaeon]
MKIDNKINKNSIFFDVDTQHDYLSEASNKVIKNSSQIKKNLAKLTQYAIENDIKILGSVDVNSNTDNNKFNINETDIITSRNKISETFVQGTIFVPNRKVSEEIISKAIKSGYPVLVEKQAYSCFQNQNTEIIVNKIIENNISQAIVYGVATEYCVKEAVLGLLSRGIKVYVVKDAIGAINESAGIVALKEMKEAGATLVKSKDVLIHKEIIR